MKQGEGRLWGAGHDVFLGKSVPLFEFQLLYQKTEDRFTTDSRGYKDQIS